MHPWGRSIARRPRFVESSSRDAVAILSTPDGLVAHIGDRHRDIAGAYYHTTLRAGPSGAMCPDQTRPWQCLNFLPEPQGQGALRGVPAHGERGGAGRGPLRSAPLAGPVRR